MVSRIGGLALVAVLFSCGGDTTLTGPSRWITMKAGSGLSLDRGELLIWQGGKERVFLESAEEDPSRLLVHVNFDLGSTFEEEIARDERLLLLKPAQFGMHGEAIMELADVSELNILAGKAHTANHLCGSIEVLRPMPVGAGLVGSAVERSGPILDATLMSDKVQDVIDAVEVANIEAKLKTLEAIGTRMHSQAGGKTATSTVQSMFQTIIDASGYDEASVELFTHSATEQKSVIVSVPGEVDERVIFGAHLDSINRSGDSLNAPGADDDASGVATMLEIFRVLAEAGVRPYRTLEFHAYAAEEIGLVGSGDIAASYLKAGTKVAAMLQMDMNAYHRDPDALTIYLVSTDTSPLLVRQLKLILKNYLGGDYETKSLASGSSDHKSWTRLGYPTVFPFEDPEAYNFALHSLDDNFATLNNLPLSARFAKMGAAFAIHYAGAPNLLTAEDLVRGTAVSAKLGEDLVGAVTEAEGDAVHLAIATDDATNQVEWCVVASVDASSCTRELSVLALETESDQRKVFVSGEAFSPTSGMYLMLTGYDDDDVMIHRRIVKLRKR